MNKIERMKEIMKASPNFGKGVGYKMCVVDEFHDMKELLEENAKLKAYNEKLLNGDIEKHNKIVELQEEIKKWKDEWQEQVQKANNESYARTLQTIQLNKAKEIIKNWLQWANDDIESPKFQDLVNKAEQFLGELDETIRV